MSAKLPSNSPKKTLEGLLRAIALAAGLLLLVALGQFARTGLLVRYWADDYCYSWVMRAGGMLCGPIDWYMASGNRFSTILLVGLQDLFGPAAIRAIPALVLGLWVLAWVVCLQQVARLFNLRIALPWLVVFALTQVFFAALLAPDRLQTIYWRMGTLHYTFPLILLLCALALMAVRLRRAGHGLLWGAAFFGLAFFAGGFSETFAALQAGAYLLLIAAGAWTTAPPRPSPSEGEGERKNVFFARLWRAKNTKKAPTPAMGPQHPDEGGQRLQKAWGVSALLPALAGALAAMLLMMLSPSNAWRQAALPPTPSLINLILLILRYTFDFTRDTLRGLPLPLLALALLSALAAYAGFWRGRAQAIQPTRVLLAALACLTTGLLLAACAIAPSVYAGGQFPAGRALMPTRFALLSAIALAAACLPGLLPVRLRISNPAAIAAALLTLAACFYPLRAAAALEPQRRELAAWAARWDERDVQILSLRAQGQTDPLVRQVEVVSGLEDYGPDTVNWVNRCAAGYYQLHSITAQP